MLLHTILAHTQKQQVERGVSITMSDIRFMKFIGEVIFPGGQLPAQEDLFKLRPNPGSRSNSVQLLQEHYERTLNIWAANLEANKDKAIAIQSEEIYERYMHYLTGCENFFRKGICNVGQFTCVK